SEIIAMRAVGLSMSTLLLPAVVLSLLESWASAQTSLSVAPWGNRQFEVLVHNLGSQKAAGVIRAGTFSEGFFQGLVIYAGNADAKSGLLEEIFIYDE